MSLISVANFQAYTDHEAAVYDLASPILGLSTGNPVAGTVRNLFNLLNNLITTTVADAEQQLDLLNSTNQAYTKSHIVAAFGLWQGALTSLNTHFTTRGKEVAAAIVDINSYLTYYNGGSGGALFSSMVVPSFATLWSALSLGTLPAAGVMSAAINPTTNASATNGMGIKAVGGSFTAGLAVNTAIASEVNVLAVVTTNFSGGSAPPTIVIAGIDHTGASGTTWTAQSISGNNPSASVSTTITPAVVAQARQTVALGSTTGIVAGSCLTVNSGLIDQEVIIVESVGGGSITAVFLKAHSAGAAITGSTSYACTPSVSGRRCRSVSGITIGITGHVAGQCRIDGIQDRVGV